MTWDGFTFSNAQTAPTTSEARNAWKDDFGSTTQEKGRPTRDVAVRYDSCGVRSSAASLRHGRSRNRFRVGPGPREERSSREDTIFCLHSHARKEHVRLPSGPIEPRSGSPFPKLVEPARERSERLCRNHPAPGSQNLTTVTLVSTRSARWRSRIGLTSFERDGLDSICSLALVDRLNQFQGGRVAARLNQLRKASATRWPQSA